MKKRIKDLPSDLRKAMDGRIERIKRNLASEGAALRAHAIENGEYKDVTGNLRSSIAFRATADGEVIAEEGWEKIKGARKPPKSGLTLSVAAGAPYARYVEDKGYNVLHLTAEKMKDDIGRILSE